MSTRATTPLRKPVFGALLAVAAFVAAPAAAGGLVSIPPPAPTMTLQPIDSRARDIGCLADAIYYEAANQPVDGRRAVAQVVLNRLRNQHYPKSVCGVVYQGAPRRGCQFTFACDGSLARTPTLSARRDAEALAAEALDGAFSASVGNSTHYHTLAVHPYWSAALTPTVRIGAHQFYGSPREGGAGALRPTASPDGALAGLPLAVPQASRFSVWGLEVAQLSPVAGGVSVTPGEPTP